MTSASKDRYTVIFTGSFPGRRPGEYPYLTGGEHESGAVTRGRPPAERLGREVEFSELPERVQRRTMREYRRLWNL